MQNKLKIIVTGSEGFLGKPTVTRLRSKGHLVATRDMEWNIFENGLPDQKYDVLIHFAAYVGGCKSVEKNLLQIMKNIELDRQVLEWAETHVDRMIYTSDCAAYPKKLQMQPGTPFKEDMIGDEPFDVYGLTKLTTEKMLELSNLKCHIVRPFNIYGPDQNNDHPLPAIIERAKRAECSVWGSGDQVRDWVHVNDAVTIFEYLVDRQEPIVLNIGSGKPVTFKHLAQTVFKEVHGDYSFRIRTIDNQPEGASYRCADITLLRSLGLEPKISLEQGIKDMLDSKIQN